MAVGVTVAGLVIGSARDTSTQARDSASARPRAALIWARTAATVSAAATGSAHARVTRATTIDGQQAYVLVLTGSAGPPATVWISRSTWLPVLSASPGASVIYEWTAPGTIRAATLWPDVPPGLARIPPE